MTTTFTATTPSATVMVLDDEPFALKLLTRQLSNLGYRKVLPFDRGADALAAIKSAPGTVDIVCCDLQMPGMDGVEFVRSLARLGFKGGIVLVSGEDARVLGSVDRLARAHGLKVLGAVQKPIAPDRLREVLLADATGARSNPTGAPTGCDPGELALAIQRGELFNHYQPKVAMTTGALIGVETLVRWRHPTAGLIFPDRFIDVAERHGLIHDLTQTVLRTALHEAAAWISARPHLHVAVNVSMLDLASLDFPDLVEAIAHEAKVPLTSLVLEVTESQALTNPMDVLDILSRLRLKRVGLSIDDFGTGYSSLTQLIDLPFDELKIDRSFVSGVHTDVACGVVVEASLNVARRLGMSTVAEGVETEDDWRFLRDAGCELAQGYFIARPMPAEQLLAWCAEWQGRAARLAPFGAG